MTQRNPVQLGLTDTIRRTSHWLSAVVTQLDRIDHAVAESHAGTFDPEALLSRIARLEIDEYFFLAAIRKLDRWLERARTVDSTLETPTQAFAAALPYLAEIRNMWEHDDEYLHGEGNQQADYVRSEIVKDLPQSAGASMIWTDPTHGVRHVIGNRFDLEKARTAVRDLAPHVIAALKRTTPMRVVARTVTLGSEKGSAPDDKIQQS